jgi:hypothetical protein
LLLDTAGKRISGISSDYRFALKSHELFHERAGRAPLTMAEILIYVGGAIWAEGMTSGLALVLPGNFLRSRVFCAAGAAVAPVAGAAAVVAADVVAARVPFFLHLHQP